MAVPPSNVEIVLFLIPITWMGHDLNIYSFVLFFVNIHLGGNVTLKEATKRKKNHITFFQSSEYGLRLDKVSAIQRSCFMFQMNNPVKKFYKSMKSTMFIVKTKPQKEWNDTSTHTAATCYAKS